MEEVMKTKRVTAKLLLEHAPCSGQVKLFRKLFPRGVVPTRKIAVKYASYLYFTWAGQHLLPVLLRAEFERQRAPLWEEYKRQEVPLWEEYKRQEVPLWAKYQRRCVTLWADYKKYQRRRAPLWAKFQRQRAPLWAEYERQCAVLFVELWKKYSQKP